MDSVGIQLLIGAIFGLMVGAIANSKGRSGIGWGVFGFFFGCIALIVVLVLPDLNAERRKDASSREERRRLREQLRQERMKTEAYRRHVSARLDAHDNELGMDTRTVQSLPEGHGLRRTTDGARPGQLGAGTDPAQPFAAPVGAPGAAPGAAASGGTPTGSTVKEWFYERGGESRGPVSEAAIRMGLQNGKIDGTTLVWREGMPNWQALGEVPVFGRDFRG